MGGYSGGCHLSEATSGAVTRRLERGAGGHRDDATKMASVFMMRTSTVAIYTGVTPRGLAFVGYGMSVLLLFGSDHIGWGFVVFPLWVLMTSIHILFDNIPRRAA
jgi:hypothetical protein